MNDAIATPSPEPAFGEFVFEGRTYPTRKDGTPMSEAGTLARAFADGETTVPFQGHRLERMGEGAYRALGLDVAGLHMAVLKIRQFNASQPGAFEPPAARHS